MTDHPLITEAEWLETALENARKLGTLSEAYLDGFASAAGWVRRHGEQAAAEAEAQEQADAVADMARKLAHKLGDPRGIPRTQLERHEPTLTDRLRHDLERPIDLDDPRPPKHIDDIAADLERSLGRPPTYGEVAKAYDVQRRHEAIEDQRDRDELARERDREWDE